MRFGEHMVDLSDVLHGHELKEGEIRIGHDLFEGALVQTLLARVGPRVEPHSKRLLYLVFPEQQGPNEFPLSFETFLFQFLFMQFGFVVAIRDQLEDFLFFTLFPCSNLKK